MNDRSRIQDELYGGDGRRDQHDEEECRLGELPSRALAQPARRNTSYLSSRRSIEVSIELDDRLRDGVVSLEHGGAARTGCDRPGLGPGST
jgi:hypothetical protein